MFCSVVGVRCDIRLGSVVFSRLKLEKNIVVVMFSRVM